MDASTGRDRANGMYTVIESEIPLVSISYLCVYLGRVALDCAFSIS
jgi:hypothetical protein